MVGFLFMWGMVSVSMFHSIYHETLTLQFVLDREQSHPAKLDTHVMTSAARRAKYKSKSCFSRHFAPVNGQQAKIKLR